MQCICLCSYRVRHFNCHPLTTTVVRGWQLKWAPCILIETFTVLKMFYWYFIIYHIKSKYNSNNILITSFKYKLSEMSSFKNNPAFDRQLSRKFYVFCPECHWNTYSNGNLVMQFFKPIPRISWGNISYYPYSEFNAPQISK